MAAYNQSFAFPTAETVVAEVPIARLRYASLTRCPPGATQSPALFQATALPHPAAADVHVRAMNDAIRKAEVLIEALSYIRNFRDRLTVIKLGGSAMADQAAL